MGQIYGPCNQTINTYAVSCGYEQGQVLIATLHECVGDGSTKTGCYTGSTVNRTCGETAVYHSTGTSPLGYDANGKAVTCTACGSSNASIFYYECTVCKHIAAYYGVHPCNWMAEQWQEQYDKVYKCSSVVGTMYAKTCGKEDGHCYFSDGTEATILCNKRIESIAPKNKSQILYK